MNNVGQARSDGTVLGLPLGELGGFQAVLMSLAAGFAAFFFGTFCAIVGMLVWMSTTHRHPDFGLTYRYVGLPLGLVVLVAAAVILGTQWARQRMRRLRAR